MGKFLTLIVLAITTLTLTSCHEIECFKAVDLSYDKDGEGDYSANVPCYLEVGDKWGEGYVVMERE